MNRKILLLCGKDNVLFDFSNMNNIEKHDVYKKKNKIILKILYNTNFFYKFSLASWYKDISEYTDIIIFDSNFKYGFVNAVKKKNKDININLYFRNTIRSRKKLKISTLKNMDIKIWSYNYFDCDLYKLLWNKQNWNPILSKISKSEIKSDILFIGASKNRYNFLKEIYSYCNRNNLTTFFFVNGYNNEKFNNNKNNLYMDYEDYISLAKSTNVILDLVTEENYAITLRPLEALFLEKKLITTYKEIIHEDYYHENNIFILDNNLILLDDFLKKPYKKINNDIKEKYTCENWILNFFK